MKDYKANLNHRYWQYQETRFSPWSEYLERPHAEDGRPPVFLRRESWRNVLIDPTASQQEKDRLLALVPLGERHRWYGSMNSSQALAQSILGNLAIQDRLGILVELKDDEGLDLFGEADLSSHNFTMEHKIHYLGEPRQTSLDGYFAGDYRVAVECKFTEPALLCENPPCCASAAGSGSSRK